MTSKGHRFVLASLAVALSFANADISEAEVLAYEGFNYTGTSLDGQSGGGSYGFSDAWSGDVGLSNDGVSLDSDAFPFDPVGSRTTAKNSNAARSLSTTLDFSAEGEVMYLSALMRKNSTNNPGTEYLELQGFGTGGTIFKMGLSSGEQFNAAFAFEGRNNLVGTVVEDTTYFLVLKLVSHETADDELYFEAYGPNDTVPTTEPTSWLVSDSYATDLEFSDLRIYFANIDDNGEFDELRVGRTWGDVVPEPSSLAILFVGALAASLLVTMGRFRCKN